MQFKSLFFVVSIVAAAFAAHTVDDITAGLSKVDAAVTTLQTGISSFPQNGGNMQQAMNVHNSVDDVVAAVEATLKVAVDIEGPVSVDDGKTILNIFHNMVPIINVGLNAVVEKKDALVSLGIGRAQAIIALDLQHLLKAVVDLETSLLAITPPECLDEAKTLAASVKASLDASIKVYVA
ncbi:hypothetical protein D9756_008483 [Leucocoprinus leucothites]|uniref:Hydrophobic surface binding protein n=1 Tax=Leucocoprinus leucothites TaxID=201217 RepID=A0A8H5CZ40_9AGAR|nr:hypothetical protein D9756_008483 [Leucoagaricus leucothites]